MRARPTLVPIFFLCTAPLAYSACLPFEEAGKHIGDSECIIGRVLQVSEAASGVTFLNFCADYRTCPFTVVVFPRDLRHVGDVRQLTGKQIQIHGDIKAYDGRPEIVLREARQLRGTGVKLPPLPKQFDVERRGRYSAGRYQHPQTSRKPAPHPRRQSDNIPVEEPE